MPPERGQGRDVAPAYPGKEEDEGSRRDDEERRSEVRLTHDQHDRHEREQPAEHDSPQSRRQVALGNEPGDHQRHRQLHELRGLKAEGTDSQPSLRALRGLSHHEHGAQQRYADQIEQRRPVEESPGRNLGNDEHHPETDREPNRLSHHQVRILSTGAVERHEPERGEHQHPEQQGHVQVQPFAESDSGLHRSPQPGTGKIVTSRGSRPIVFARRRSQRTLPRCGWPGYRRARRRSRCVQGVPPSCFRFHRSPRSPQRQSRGSSTGANATKSPWS